MKRVIQFSNARYFFFGFSALLILIGIVGYIVNHGFNLGVDFKAGIALQFQVAPASFTVQYTGPDKAEISIPAGEQALTSAGNIIITITSAKDGTHKDYPFRYAEFSTVRALTEAIGKVPGVTVQAKGNMDAVPTSLVPLPRPADITGKPYYHQPEPGTRAGASRRRSPTCERPWPLLASSSCRQSVRPSTRSSSRGSRPRRKTRPSRPDTEAKVMSFLEAKYGAARSS